jgi:hypothetical protein
MKDEGFRQRLLKNPKDAIQKELGLELPKQITVQVHENSATVVHLVLPAPLDLSTDRTLSESELGQVAGGATTKPTLVFVTSQCKTGPICGGLPT